MLRQLFNLRSALALIAVAIVTGTIFYSNFLSKKIAVEERERINQWVEANKFIANAPQNVDITLASEIQQKNTDIPIIWTNENDSIIDSRNIDTSLIKENPDFLKQKLKEFKSAHRPIILELSKNPYVADKYYYGDSKLLKQVRYYPIVQLLIVALFIFLIFYAISVRNKSTQNQVWAGMAKETAHQLGTPISSLQGWVEMLKESETSYPLATEMEKDVDRLKLISDRFGKIGSTPHLDESNISEQVEKMVAYIKRRSTEKVSFVVDKPSEQVIARISKPLFDWVIENLLKNALDAIKGKGTISVSIKKFPSRILVDVTDNGRGISKQNLPKVFKPGFTTKKRGWGLGLSLAKRIIEKYHKGQLFVKSSEPGKGTTFRIVLNTEGKNSLL
ncbi:MAG TPA: HAMP domain-containing sensor histidine kinase [Hanamia sp.]|jgi:signal transduction histidine kinase|nr:HAMP domain-containing sensor histidine kinase [Hanamia sp.]